MSRLNHRSIVEQHIIHAGAIFSTSSQRLRRKSLNLTLRHNLLFAVSPSFLPPLHNAFSNPAIAFKKSSCGDSENCYFTGSWLFVAGYWLLVLNGK
jgi:hypothetical protein